MIFEKRILFIKRNKIITNYKTKKFKNIFSDSEWMNQN